MKKGKTPNEKKSAPTAKAHNFDKPSTSMCNSRCSKCVGIQSCCLCPNNQYLNTKNNLLEYIVENAGRFRFENHKKINARMYDGYSTNIEQKN